MLDEILAYRVVVTALRRAKSAARDRFARFTGRSGTRDRRTNRRLSGRGYVATEIQAETCSAQRRIGYVDAAAGTLEHETNQSQADAAARCLSFAAFPQCEDPLAIGAFYAWTIIIDGDPNQLRIDKLDRDRERSARPAMLDCVVKEIDEDES